MNTYKIVTESCSDIRALARSALKGNWQMGIIVTLVYILLFQGVSSLLAYLFPVTLMETAAGPVTTSYAESLYTLFTAGAFTYGYIAFALSLFRKQPTGVAKLFDGFEHIIKLFGLTVLMGIFIALWSILLIIPGIIAAYRYSQAYNILYDHPEYGILKCISESKKMMTGNKGKLFALSLSYLGWIILASIPTMALAVVFRAQELANPTLPVVITEIIGLLFMAPAALYLSMGEMAFYELASGNLTRQVIDVMPISSDAIATMASEVREEGGVSLSKPGETEEAKQEERTDGINLDK